MMFFAAVIKEFKLVFRDLHSVLVLFLMPAAFIIIMSLALQDQFADKQSISMKVYYSQTESGVAEQQFLALLNQSDHFQFVAIPLIEQETKVIERLGDESRSYVKIPGEFAAKLRTTSQQQPIIQLLVSPSIDIRNRLLLESLLKAALIQTRLALTSANLAVTEPKPVLLSDNAVQSVYLHGAGSSTRPTAVQQNVPAWLIFSMFFVVIPISTTLITERQQGTLIRLRAMNISMPLFLTAKALPYLVINQLQLLIMLLLGVYLVPLLGGDSLNIGNHYLALMLMSLAVGISAIGYALLVAVMAKTTAQATSAGGVGNILLAAIGGIMVPAFVMPAYLQPLTKISPMAWGLDGFLEILLYGNGVSAIADELLMLLAFGGVMLILALVIFNKRLAG